MLNKSIGRVSVLVIALCLLTSYHSFAATIVLDPGHGGSNPGAIGVNRLQEKDVNFAVTLKLRELLSEMGYNVLLTREQDVDMSLDARVQFKEKHNADLFVSIHANAHRDANAQGSLVLYYDQRYPNPRYPASPEMVALSETNKQLAQTVLNELLTETNYVDQGIVPSSVYVVRKGTMPSILVELAFLSNWEDAVRLADDKERDLMARGIANGIAAFWPLGVFRDIASHWASSSITRIQEQGIVTGANERYHPDRALTRAEFLTIMDRVFQFSVVDVSKEQVIEKDREIDSSINGNTDDAIDQAHGDDVDGAISGVDGEINDVDGAISGVDGGINDVDGGINGIDEENRRIDNGDIKSKMNIESELKRTSESDDIRWSTLEKTIDIDQTHWAYDTMRKAVELGIVQGYPDGTIRPDAPINRAEVSVLFDRIWQAEQHDASEADSASEALEPSESIKISAASCDRHEDDELQTNHEQSEHNVVPSAFIDVSNEQWYAHAVQRLANASLVRGVSDIQFAPYRHMTRAEIATIIDRFLSHHDK